MRKSISKELIIETTLDLLKNESDVHNVNLRKVARVIGCAHTNLYNYFASFNDLLWEAHIQIQNKFIEQISKTLENEQDKKIKLYLFYYSLSEFYLDNKGWFRLAWLDYIDDIQPTKDKIVTVKTVNSMVEILRTILSDIYPNSFKTKQIYDILHNVHCYIVGEVSNFINGRGLIQDKQLLKKHIAETSVSFFILSLKGAETVL